MAPPTTTTARLTRGEAGRCARPLSLEPLKLEDGDHTGVEESPAEQRHPSLSTTTFARPPAERRHPSSSTTTSPRPPAERRHPLTVDDPFSSATGGATAPSWLALHIQAQRFKPSIDRRHHTAVETPKCSSATRPALHVQARHRPDAAITAKTQKCNPTTRPALHVQVRHRPAAAVAGRRRADHPEELRGAGELTCNLAPEHALARTSVHALPDRCKCTHIARLAS